MPLASLLGLSEVASETSSKAMGSDTTSTFLLELETGGGSSILMEEASRIHNLSFTGKLIEVILMYKKDYKDYVSCCFFSLAEAPMHFATDCM